jgi:predicted transcriptional regulator
MARNTSILTHGIQGAIGKSVVFKTVNGAEIAASYPDRSHVKYTKKQADYQNLFALAAAYASEIVNDPEKNKAYVLKIRKGSSRKRKMDVYHYAVQEFMNMHSKKVPGRAIDKICNQYSEVFQLDERETEVVQYLSAQGRMSNADYRRLTGVSKPTATRHLGAMVQKGLISCSSRGAGAVYTLVPLAEK